MLLPTSFQPEIRRVRSGNGVRLFSTLKSDEHVKRKTVRWVLMMITVIAYIHTYKKRYFSSTNLMFS